MSLEPDALDIGVATATYHDMLQMVDDEKKLRKNLLEWVRLLVLVYFNILNKFFFKVLNLKIIIHLIYNSCGFTIFFKDVC